MASKRAIGTALKMLGRAFAGVVDAARVDVYSAALDDLTDEQVALATTRVIRTHTGEFIPPPAILRKAVAPAPVAVDSMSIVRQIEKLAAYAPGGGMIAPPTSVVAQQLGPVVAYAYARAGGPRLFSENETGRDIALRDFERAIHDAANRPEAELPVLGAGVSFGSIDGSVLKLIEQTTSALPKANR